MVVKEIENFIYFLGNYKEINNFCIKNNLTILKVKNNLTNYGKEFFKNYKYFTKQPKKNIVNMFQNQNMKF